MGHIRPQRPPQPSMGKGMLMGMSYCSLWGATLPRGLWRQGLGGLMLSGDSVRSCGGPEHMPGPSRASWLKVQESCPGPVLGSNATLYSPSHPGSSVLGSPFSPSLLSASESGSRTQRWLCLPSHWISLLGLRVKLYSWSHSLIILIRTTNSMARHFQICWIWNILEIQVTDT